MSVQRSADGYTVICYIRMYKFLWSTKKLLFELEICSGAFKHLEHTYCVSKSSNTFLVYSKAPSSVIFCTQYFFTSTSVVLCLTISNEQHTYTGVTK